MFPAKQAGASLDGAIGFASTIYDHRYLLCNTTAPVSLTPREDLGSADDGRLAALATTVADALGIEVRGGFAITSSADAPVGDAVTAALGKALSRAAASLVSLDEEGARWAAGEVRDRHERSMSRITPPGRPEFLAQSLGARSNPAVLVWNACGMPMGLIRPWLDALSEQHFVVTWETPGLFPAADGTLPPLSAVDVKSQAVQLDDVAEHYGLDQVHVVGLCGGSALALAAAASSDCVVSLSLLHGDYELGDAAPKTAHQRGMESLLSLAGQGVAGSESVFDIMRRPQVVDAMPEDLAPFLIYPYSTPDLVARYGALNGAVMTTDFRDFCATPTRTLVVTSRGDDTAHPAGSHHIAARLPAGHLAEIGSGGHLDAFRCPAAYFEAVTDFIVSTSNATHGEEE